MSLTVCVVCAQVPPTMTAETRGRGARLSVYVGAVRRGAAQHGTT